jgi:hypothetical protein
MTDIVTWQEEGLKWGSHLPALLGCVAATCGPVLEIGAGHYSTPTLHALCVVLGRELITVENNPEWLGQFARYRSMSHRVIEQTDEVLLELAQRHWSVVFVDDQGGETRVNRLAMFFEHADYLLFHDYQFPSIKADLDEWLRWKEHQSFVYDEYLPSTLIVSKNLEIPVFTP